jgi:hypothetical protein
MKFFLNFTSTWHQGCGSGTGSGSGFGSGFCDFVDPDLATLWIRIRIGNPDPGSGSRGKKITKYQCKNALFSYLKKNVTTIKV